MTLNTNHRTRAWTESQVGPILGMNWLESRTVSISVIEPRLFKSIKFIGATFGTCPSHTSHCVSYLFIISLGRWLTYHVTQEFSLKSNCTVLLNLESWLEEYLYTHSTRSTTTQPCNQISYFAPIRTFRPSLAGSVSEDPNRYTGVDRPFPAGQWLDGHWKRWRLKRWNIEGYY